MNIQEVLTLFINLVVITSIIFFLLDFFCFLLTSWHQLSPDPSGDDFYRQVKDLLWDDHTKLATS